MATALERKRPRSRSVSSSSDDESGSDQNDRKRFKVSAKMPAAPKEGTPPPKRKREEQDPLLTRTGGAYIPPARLRMMQEAITDKSSAAYQRLTWEALKKSINGLVNKVNVSNISNIVRELFQENLIRGKGLFARSVIQAQAASPMFSHVYAALVAIINTKLPRVGELIIKRLMVRFKRSFSRKDKAVCISTVKFIAHLVNQHVLYELVALELLTLLLDEPTDDSVEVAVGFVKDCGLSLREMNSQALHTVFETFRSILHSGKLTSRVQYMIEVLFAVRKDNFKDHPSVLKELDLVHEDDQHTHFMSLLDENIDVEDRLNVFHADPDYLENEEAYKSIRDEILGEDSEESGSEDEEDEEESEEESEDEETEEKLEISDQTFTSELALRRQIYLTIMSSLDFEECAHKLLKTMKEGQEKEIAFMLVECCAQERSYMRFYGMLGQRLCLLNQAWVAVFDEAFQQQYSTVHRLETNKLRNVAKFFSQLLYVDALPWTSLHCVHLNEEETNSSSRIFVKIVFQQLAEFMGLVRLNDRLRDPMLAESFEGILPRDNPKNTRFAINFFTSIGLGGLTDDLREHLKNAQKVIMTQKQDVSSDSSTSSSSSSDTSEESSSDEDSSSDSSGDDNEATSSSSEEERRKRKKFSHSERKNASKRRGREGHSRRGGRASEEDGRRRKKEHDKKRRKRDEDEDDRSGRSRERRERSRDNRRTERKSPDGRSPGKDRNTERKKREKSPEDRRRERSQETSVENKRRERSVERRRERRKGSPTYRGRDRSPDGGRKERHHRDGTRSRDKENR